MNLNLALVGRCVGQGKKDAKAGKDDGEEHQYDALFPEDQQ